MAFSVEYTYRVVDKFSTPLGKIKQKLGDFTKAIEKSSQKLDRLGSRLTNTGSKLTNVGAAIGSAAIVAGVATYVKAATTMEDAMGDVERVTSLTGSGLKDFEKTLTKMSMQTGTSAVDLAAMATAGGKLGIADDKLLDFVRMVEKTGKAFDIPAEEAGRAIGSISDKLGLAVEDVNTLMQRVNYLADNTAANGSHIVEIIERTSGSFRSLKIPPEVAAGWAGFADMMETSPELAASGLRMMFSRMQKIPGMAAKMLDDPTKAAREYLAELGKIDPKNRSQVIRKVFGEEAARFVTRAVEGIEKLDDTMKKAASNDALGSMDREFAQIMSRASTKISRIAAIYTAIKVSIGKTFMSTFTHNFDRLEKVGLSVLAFTEAHPKLIKIVSTLLIAIVAFTTIAFAVGLFISALGTVATVMGAILSPAGAVLGVFAAVGFAIAKMYKHSGILRAAFQNVADACRPMLEAIKVAWEYWTGGALEMSSKNLEKWGDRFAAIINMIAGLIKGVSDSIIWISKNAVELPKMWKDDGNKYSYDQYLKGNVGMDAARAKAQRVDANVSVSTDVSVKAEAGTSVTKAKTTTNAGSNQTKR